MESADGFIVKAHVVPDFRRVVTDSAEPRKLYNAGRLLGDAPLLLVKITRARRPDSMCISGQTYLYSSLFTASRKDPAAIHDAVRYFRRDPI